MITLFWYKEVSMKRKAYGILFILLVFACGWVVGMLGNEPRKAEAGYGCIYYTTGGCYNSGAPGDELYIDAKFSRPMTYLRMAYNNDKKEDMIYFLPQ